MTLLLLFIHVRNHNRRGVDSIYLFFLTENNHNSCSRSLADVFTFCWLTNAACEQDAMPPALSKNRSELADRLLAFCRDGEFEKASELVISNMGIINVDDTNDANGVTALHWAADRGEIDMIKLLIGPGGGCVDPKNSWNSTPLFWAANNGHDDAVIALIESKASISSRNHNNWSPFHACIRAGALKAAKYIAEKYDTVINMPAHGGVHPIHLGCIARRVDVVQYLLSTGKTSINVSTHSGVTPLHLACKLNYVDMASYLIEQDADLDAQNADGATPLHICAQKRYYELCRKLILSGADSKLSTISGWTALHWFAEQGQLELCKLVVKHGGGVSSKLETDGGDTPIELADIQGHVAICSYLLPIQKINYDQKDES